MKNLRFENQIELIKEYQEGNKELLKYLVELNYGLVKNIVFNLVKNNTTFLIDDMVQEGCLYLIKAFNYFDINKDYTFSTYATTVIRNGLILYLQNNSGRINRRVKSKQKSAAYIQLKTELVKKENRYLSYEDISTLGNIPIDEVMALEKTLIPDLYLQSDSVDIESECFLLSEEETILDYIYKEDLKMVINDILLKANLSGAELLVLKYRYGFNCEIKTFDEISKELKLTKQGVANIEYKALKKLRTTNNLRKLSDYSIYCNHLNSIIDNVKYNYYVSEDNFLNSFITYDIYEVIKRFKSYTNEEIDYVITLLSDEDKDLLDRKFKSKNNLIENTYFYNYLVPLMLSYLEAHKKTLEYQRIYNK